MSGVLKSLTVVLALGLLVSQAPAQDAAKPKAVQAKADPPKVDPPKADNAEADEELAIVKALAVKNNVKRRAPAEEQHWYKVHKDQEMNLYTIIKTGFNSHVKLAFGDNSVVTMESATMMGISEFRKHGKVTKTHLHLKYGALRMTIDKARGPNDWRVQTPVMTLSALGTKGRLVYRDGVLLLEGQAGMWGVSHGPQKSVKPGEFANGKDRSINIVKSFFDVLMLDTGKGLGDEERKLLRYRGGGRNIFQLTSNPVARPTVTSNSGKHIVE